MPLTDIAVRKATPREKPYRLADGGGMYLEVAPSGGKYWRLKYRFAGKEKRLALGVYPDVSLAAAREKRDDARKKLAADIDPGEAKKADKRAVRLAATNSFEAVALGWMDELKPYVTGSDAGCVCRVDSDSRCDNCDQPVGRQRRRPRSRYVGRRLAGREDSRSGCSGPLEAQSGVDP